MAATAHIGGQRAAIYAALQRRNRIVAVLRVAVPLGGLALFSLLSVQIVEANLANDFSIASMSITNDRLNVGAPTYSGQLSDGSSFSVTSERAEAALGQPNIIELSGTRALLNRANGEIITALAAEAELDAEAQTVTVPGVTDIARQDGLTANVNGLHIDVVKQVVTADGPASLRTAEGQTLEAKSMRFDVAAKRWTFEGVVMTLPSTPGEEGAP